MATAASLISKDMILLHGPRLRRWILSVIVAGVPLIFLRFTNDPFNVPKLALLAAGVSLVLAIKLIELLQGASSAGLTRLVVPAVAIGAPLLVAWALSPYRYWSLFGHYGRFQGLVPYLLVIVLGVLVADAFAEDIPLLAWALTISGGVAGAYAVLQFVGLDPFPWAQQFGGETTRTSTLGNPNFTGGFLAMVLPIAAGLWRSAGRNSERASQATVVIAAGLILSFSQGPYAAAVAGGVAFVGLSLSGTFRPARTLSLIVVSGIAALILGAVGYAMLNPTSDAVPLTTAQRALWWRGAVSMVADHPVVGSGPNTYAVEGNRYRPPDDAAVHGLDYSDDTHSVPLAFATGAGALGLFGFLIVVGWGISKARAVDGQQLVQVGFIAALAAYFVQSLVSIDEIALRTTSWAVLGGVAASFFAPRPTKPRSKAARTKAKSAAPKRRPAQEPAKLLPLVALFALIGVVGVWWSGAFVLNDARVRWAIGSFRAGQPDEGARDFERAIAFRGDYRYRHFYGFFAGETALDREKQGSAWLAEARGAFNFLEDTPLVPALVDEARLLHEYSELDPALEPNAAAAYSRLVRLDPHNIILLAEAAPVLAEDGRFELILQILRGDMEHVDEKSPSLWGYVAWAQAELGNEVEAEQALEKALQLDPDSEATKRAKRLLGTS